MNEKTNPTKARQPIEASAPNLVRTNILLRRWQTSIGGILLLAVLVMGVGGLYLVSGGSMGLGELMTNPVSILPLGLGTLLLGLLIWLVTARLLRHLIFEPLAKLQRGLEQIAQGNLSHRLPLTGEDELGQIFASFNRMATRLDERQQQLDTEKASLTTELAQCRQNQAVLQQAWNALQHHNQLLVQVLGVGHLLQRNLNPGSLFQEIVQTIHYSLGFEVVVLSLLDEAGRELRPRAFVGMTGEERQLFEQAVYAWEDFAILLQDRFRIGQCYFFPHDGVSAGSVGAPSQGIKSGSNGRLQNDRWHPEDSLLVPIELRPGQIAGILSLGQPTDGKRPNLETIQVLEVFAGQTAAAIENARLYEQVQRDLIERKQTAEQLAKLNAELEDRVRERTAELATTNETLQIEILERQRAEEQIMASLKEKEMLLQEIHHRVKNNLQVISSLLNLQAGYIDSQEIRDVFRDSQNRVRSMALVHEKLYRSEDLSRIDLAEYIRNLANFLFNSYQATAGRIALEIQADDVFLGIDAAVPCGLMLNELISNALKHAFPNDRPGRIQVELRREDEQNVVLIVRDDGIGFPPEFNLAETDSLGMQLVDTLVEQLDGTLQINGQAGTEFKIIFPVV